MVQPVKTQALAAYIESRKMTFVGAAVTLQRLAQMLALPPETIKGATVNEAALVSIARYLKMSLEELLKAVAAQPAPVSVASAPVTFASAARAFVPATRAVTMPPAPVTVPAPVVTIVIPPVTPAPAPAPATPEPEPEVTITFDDVEATPIPEVTPPATSAEAPTKPAKGKSKKPKSH